jgi:hypothetical protein
VIAAVGHDGFRPVVWGVGSDEDAAREDAARWLAHPQNLICVEVNQLVATRIEAGEVDCEALGIGVRVDRDGEIVDADLIMLTTYSIDDGHGNLITTGLASQTARSTAQRIADERGESVYLYADPDGDTVEIRARLAHLGEVIS